MDNELFPWESPEASTCGYLKLAEKVVKRLTMIIAYREVGIGCNTVSFVLPPSLELIRGGLRRNDLGNVGGTEGT